MKKHKKDKTLELLEYILREDNPAPPPQNMADFAPVETPKDVSLDQVVDRYIIRYEKESIPTSEDYGQQLLGGEGKIPHYSTIIQEALLVEQPEDEEDPIPEDDEEGDVAAEGEDEDLGLDLGGGGDEAGGEDEPADKAADDGTPAVVATPQINLNHFATSIARLVNNYDTLLNTKSVIVNRVEAYIKNNYNARTAEELMEMLDTNFGIRTAEEEVEKQQEIQYQTPYAAGALATENVNLAKRKIKKTK